MALSATLDPTGKTLTVVSDRRIVTVTSQGDTATAVFPITISGGPVFTVKSDDGKTATYTTP
jgi:hypothetical protein